MISITGMWVSLGVLGMFAAAGVIAFVLKMRDRALTPEDAATVAEWEAMHAEDTGGLMALPAPHVTMKIPPRDQREVTRVIARHEPSQASGPAVPVIAAGPEHQPPAAAVPGSPTAAAGPHVPGRDSARVAAAMDAPQPRPAGDLAAMPLDDYLGHIRGIEWTHVTAEFPAIRDDAKAGS